MPERLTREECGGLDGGEGDGSNGPATAAQTRGTDLLLALRDGQGCQIGLTPEKPRQNAHKATRMQGSKAPTCHLRTSDVHAL